MVHRLNWKGSWAAGGVRLKEMGGRISCLHVCILGLLCVGCDSVRPLAPIPDPLTRRQVLECYNANVAALPAFTAKVAQWRVSLTDEEGKSHSYDDRGTKLFYRPAQSSAGRARFYLLCSTLFENKALVVGSNESEFWLYSRAPGFKRGWWGKYEHQGKSCSEGLAINPELLLELVGLRPVPTEVFQQPYPVYKIYPEHNIIEYVVMAAEGLLLQREVVIDRRSNLPIEINVYDSAGMRVMQSKLGDYRRVGEAMVPGDILISSSSGEDFLELKLTKFKIDGRDRSRLFKRPYDIGGIENYAQVDERCDND